MQRIRNVEKSNRNCKAVFGTKKENYKFASDYNEIKNMNLEEIYERLLEADPDIENTSNCAWIFKQYKDGAFRLEDVPQVRDDLDLYLSLVKSKSIPENKRKLASLTLSQIREIIEPFEIKETLSISPSKSNRDFEVIDRDETGTLYKLKTREGACLLGKDTKWCTARDDENNMFQYYNEKGPLYVWYDTRSPGGKVKRYQFHFEDVQFMDEKDRPIDKETMEYFRTQNHILKRLFEDKLNDPNLAYQYAKKVIKEPWPEGEKVIKQNASSASRYARNILKRRWSDSNVEDLIATDPKSASEYARVIGKRWHKAEKVIASDPESASQYARYILKQRWSDPNVEEIIASNGKAAYEYADNVILGEWPEGEASIAIDPESAYLYAKNIIQDRWRKGEKAIATNSKFSYDYAMDVIKRRFRKGEEAISKDPNFAYNYVYNIIKRKWSKGEETIASDPESSYLYARDIIKGRFLQGEKAIATDAKFSYDYAMDVIKRRFRKGEEAISKNAETACNYALNIIDGRWPKGEPAINKDKQVKLDYEEYMRELEEWKSSNSLIYSSKLYSLETLQSLGVTALKEIAKERGISGYSSYTSSTKGELATKIYDSL